MVIDWYVCIRWPEMSQATEHYLLGNLLSLFGLIPLNPRVLIWRPLSSVRTRQMTNRKVPKAVPLDLANRFLLA